MNRPESLPPFIQLYADEGAKLWLNNGLPIRASIVYNYLKTALSAEILTSMEADSFLMLEGYLYRHEIDSEAYPSLSYYLNNRNNADISVLWTAFNQLVELEEISLIRKAYFATRRHPLETMVELSTEEKKSE
jgi:hypothetical protein